MALTLSDGVTTVSLPTGLEWVDEWEWSPVQQVETWTLSGALIVDSMERVSGRPITLKGDDDRAWIPLHVVQTLAQWAAVAGKQLTLEMRSQEMQVVFRHSDQGLEARPLYGRANPDAAWPHVVTIRLAQIA